MISPAPDLHGYLQQLGRAHGFTLEELAANRARRIHPAQLARGRKSGVAFGVVLVILSVLVFVGGFVAAFLLYDDMRPPISDVDMNGVYAVAAGGVVVALGLGAGAIAQFRGVGRSRGAYARGELHAVEGPLHKVHIWGGGTNQYRCDIGGQSFLVGRGTFELLTQGARYRFYFAASDLLSIEPA